MRARARQLCGALLALLSVISVAACSFMPATTTQTNQLLSSCPVPTPSLLPTVWQPIGGTFISVDGDPELECLVTYRYNTGEGAAGQIGGVVFDAQIGVEQPSNLVSYSLLPWINKAYSVADDASGAATSPTGYLGDKAVDIRLYDTGQDGVPDELGIMGTDAAGANKTTLSLYRWGDSGYRLIGYFHGDARVEIIDPPPFLTATNVYQGAIHTVRTVDRLNDRSGLAVVKQYDRRGQAYEYRSNWVSFLDGRPSAACFFPEGQTLVYYNERGRAVFDLRLWNEDDSAQHATVCAGVWELFNGQWQRYVSTIELEKTPASVVGACDTWNVLFTQRQPNRANCTP